MHGSARATLHHVSETRQCVHSFIACTFGSYRIPACCCPSSHQTRPRPGPRSHVPGTIELSTIPHLQLSQSDSRQMALRWGAGGHPSATNEHHAQLQLTVQMDDSFQLSFTHVRMPPMSSGRKRKLKPSHSASTSFKKKKLSVLIIKNGDELCCTRAIVAAKARLDQHPNWDGFKRGRRIQAEHAVDLHHKMRVPRGSCGYDELRAFSLAPSL